MDTSQWGPGQGTVPNLSPLLPSIMLYSGSSFFHLLFLFCFPGSSVGSVVEVTRRKAKSFGLCGCCFSSSFLVPDALHGWHAYTYLLSCGLNFWVLWRLFPGNLSTLVFFDSNISSSFWRLTPQICYWVSSLRWGPLKMSQAWLPLRMSTWILGNSSIFMLRA